jgi:hypothetical protein
LLFLYATFLTLSLTSYTHRMLIAREYPKNRNLQNTLCLIASSHTMREMNEGTQK